MKTPASIAGHPIHPMLVPIAIGCWLFSFACDLLAMFVGGNTPWPTLSYYTMVGGIVGALMAAVPGLIDLLSLPAGYTKGVAIKHMSINLLVVAIYVFNAYLRHGGAPGQGLPFILSVVTILMLLVSGWLGGKMVYEAGVGVDTPAR